MSNLPLPHLGTLSHNISQWYDYELTQVKSVVFINCGGCLNLLELLQPENQEVRFFIIDSRRPLELDNVYNQDQIILVVREGDELDVPEFDQIYSSDMVGALYKCLFVIVVYRKKGLF